MRVAGLGDGDRLRAVGGENDGRLKRPALPHAFFVAVPHRHGDGDGPGEPTTYRRGVCAEPRPPARGPTGFSEGAEIRSPGDGPHIPPAVSLSASPNGGRGQCGAGDGDAVGDGAGGAELPIVVTRGTSEDGDHGTLSSIDPGPGHERDGHHCDGRRRGHRRRDVHGGAGHAATPFVTAGAASSVEVTINDSVVGSRTKSGVVVDQARVASRPTDTGGGGGESTPPHRQKTLPSTLLGLKESPMSLTPIGMTTHWMPTTQQA